MKKLLSFIFLFLLYNYSFAQEQKHRASLYYDLDLDFSKNLNSFFGVQYQYSIDKRNNVSIHGGIWKVNYTTAGLDYTYDYPILVEGLDLNIGAGYGALFRYTYEGDIKVINYVTGNLGLTYNSTYKLPISVFVNWRPKVEITSFDSGELSSVRLGIGYRF